MSRLLVLLLMAISSTSASAVESKGELCDQLLDHLNSTQRLARYALDEVEVSRENGSFRITDIDIDGDKIADEIVLFRTGSASIIPSDNSSLTLMLSSTRAEFAIEFQGFYVIRYDAKILVVGGTTLGEDGPVLTDIYQLRSDGIKKLCAFKCGGLNRRCAKVPLGAPSVAR